MGKKKTNNNLLVIGAVLFLLWLGIFKPLSVARVDGSLVYDPNDGSIYASCPPFASSTSEMNDCKIQPLYIHNLYDNEICSMLNGTWISGNDPACIIEPCNFGQYKVVTQQAYCNGDPNPIAFSCYDISGDKYMIVTAGLISKNCMVSFDLRWGLENVTCPDIPISQWCPDQSTLCPQDMDEEGCPRWRCDLCSTTNPCKTDNGFDIFGCLNYLVISILQWIQNLLGGL